MKRVTHAARRRHNGSLIETEAVCGTKLVMPYLGSSFMQGVDCDRCRRILGYCKCCGTTMPYRIDRMCPERDGDLCERVALASDETKTGGSMSSEGMQHVCEFCGHDFAKEPQPTHHCDPRRVLANVTKPPAIDVVARQREHHDYCPYEDGFPCDCGAKP